MLFSFFILVLGAYIAARWNKPQFNVSYFGGDFRHCIHKLFCNLMELQTNKQTTHTHTQHTHTQWSTRLFFPLTFALAFPKDRPYLRPCFFYSSTTCSRLSPQWCGSKRLLMTCSFGPSHPIGETAPSGSVDPSGGGDVEPPLGPILQHVKLQSHRHQQHARASPTLFADGYGHGAPGT